MNSGNKQNNRIILLRSNGVNPDSRVEKEAGTLSENGFDVHILAWERGNDVKCAEEELILRTQKIPITRFGAKAEFGAGRKSLRPYLRFQWRVFRWLIKNRKCYEVVHACDFDTAMTASIARFFTRKKLVFDIFDYIGTNKKHSPVKVIEHLQNHIINIADAVIICSEKRKQQIQKAKPKRLVIIHNTPRMEDLETKEVFRFKNDSDRLKIVYVGILQDFRLLPEIAEAVAKMPEVEWHIGGFGKYDDFFQKMAEKNENIFYYGKLAYRDTLMLERGCDIMLAVYDPQISNHFYAAPNKFYESLMLQKPVVMVKNTGMSEFVEEHNLGVVIDYTKESFCEGIKNIAGRKEEWPAMRERMSRLYEEQFGWPTMEERLVKLYKTI